MGVHDESIQTSHGRTLMHSVVELYEALASTPGERARAHIILAGRGICPVRNILTRTSALPDGAGNGSGRGCKPRPAWKNVSEKKRWSVPVSLG